MTSRVVCCLATLGSNNLHNFVVSTVSTISRHTLFFINVASLSYSFKVR